MMDRKAKDRDSAAKIEREAAEWVVRIDRDPDAAVQLDAWMASDPRRAGAYYRALAAWRLADRARALPAFLTPAFLERWSGSAWPFRRGAEAAFTASARQKSRRLVLAGAGGLIAAGLAGGFVLLRGAPWTYRTALGQVRWAPLEDGSRAAINTATTLRVAMAEDRRVVTMEEGEAWFEVAPDATRPFIVEAGPSRVRAVGTAFAVRRDETGLEVTVTEGVVEAWRLDAPGLGVLRLAAGRRARLDAPAWGAPQAVSEAEIEGRLAWRAGMIALEGRTLGEAAAEFNRYNRRKVIVADEALARQRLVGWFRATDVDSFVAAATIALHLHAERGDDEIVLTQRRDDGNSAPAHR